MITNENLSNMIIENFFGENFEIFKSKNINNLYTNVFSNIKETLDNCLPYLEYNWGNYIKIYNRNYKSDNQTNKQWNEQFISEIAELVLCDILKKSGFEIIPKKDKSKDGPDFLVKYNGKRIHIECVSSNYKKNDIISEREGYINNYVLERLINSLEEKNCKIREYKRKWKKFGIETGDIFYIFVYPNIEEKILVNYLKEDGNFQEKEVSGNTNYNMKEYLQEILSNHSYLSKNIEGILGIDKDLFNYFIQASNMYSINKAIEKPIKYSTLNLQL